MGVGFYVRVGNHRDCDGTVYVKAGGVILPKRIDEVLWIYASDIDRIRDVRLINIVGIAQDDADGAEQELLCPRERGQLKTNGDYQRHRGSYVWNENLCCSLSGDVHHYFDILYRGIVQRGIGVRLSRGSTV